MVSCPNCGQKTSGDYCQWCKYPIMSGSPVRRHTAEQHIERQHELESKGKLINFRGLIPVLVTVAPIIAVIIVSGGPSVVPAVWHYEQGKTASDQGLYDKAIEEYTKAIRLNPKHWKARYNRGNAYYNLGQLEQAIEDYDEAIRLNTQLAVAYYNRGYAYKLQGKKAEAIADFKKVISLADDPELIEITRQEIDRLS